MTFGFTTYNMNVNIDTNAGLVLMINYSNSLLIPMRMLTHANKWTKHSWFAGTNPDNDNSQVLLKLSYYELSNVQ